jgi:hypothetical protein
MNTTFNSSVGFGNGAFGARRITRPVTLPTTKPNPISGLDLAKPGSYAPPAKRFDLAFPPLGKTVSRPAASCWTKTKVSEMFLEKEEQGQGLEQEQEQEQEEEVTLPLPRVDSYMQKVAQRKAENYRLKEAEEDRVLAANCSFIPTGRY